MVVVTSNRRPEEAIYRYVIPARESWLFEVKKGRTLRLLDLEGNQVVDILFYNVDNPRECYDAQRTLCHQRNAYLIAGSVFYSNLGHPPMTIMADTCGRHNTLSSTYTQENSTMRYASDKRYMRGCRDNFLCACLHDGRLHKRDVGANINLLMNVSVTPEGGPTFTDDILAAGKYAELCAECSIMVLIPSYPQLNNPCNGWNPIPTEVLVWN